jgi:NADPH-dependent glutamate synthase beta subunit-like oxidoreductase
VTGHHNVETVKQAELKQSSSISALTLYYAETQITANITQKMHKQDPIAIVGAGVFGLSTALNLAKRGYSNVTVYDRRNYDTGLYSYQKGCDAASAGQYYLQLYLSSMRLL